MWFPSRVILYSWLNGTAPPGSSCVLKLNLHRLHCGVILAARRAAAFPQSMAFHHSPSLSEECVKQQTVVQHVKFWLGATCPRREQLCSATAQAGQRSPLSNCCTLVKPSDFLMSLWDSNFLQVENRCLFPLVLLCPKFYRILSFVLVEWLLIYITKCKMKITQ